MKLLREGSCSIYGRIIGAIKGDTRSLDYGSYAVGYDDGFFNVDRTPGGTKGGLYRI